MSAEIKIFPGSRPKPEAETTVPEPRKLWECQNMLADGKICHSTSWELYVGGKVECAACGYVSQTVDWKVKDAIRFGDEP